GGADAAKAGAAAPAPAAAPAAPAGKKDASPKKTAAPAPAAAAKPRSAPVKKPSAGSKSPSKPYRAPNAGKPRRDWRSRYGPRDSATTCLSQFTSHSVSLQSAPHSIYHPSHCLQLALLHNDVCNVSMFSDFSFPGMK
ncbi:unnamed protein product, partial [Trichobilharzia regenti]